MLAVDTNLVVRLLTNDDRGQARRAAAIFAANEVFVPKTVLLETEWVLRHAYSLERAAIVRGLLGVLGLRSVIAEDALDVAVALDWYRRGIDFADAMHLAASGQAKRFVTFDAKFARRAKGVVPVEVVVV